MLVDASDNTIEDNDFSHASNTTMKLWTSVRNKVSRNNLSYGLRISPGEVHAQPILYCARRAISMSWPRSIPRPGRARLPSSSRSTWPDSQGHDRRP